MDPRAVLRDRTLVLHIGLHKTATTYLQNALAVGREQLLECGVLYPRSGEVTEERESTREGAQSGQAQFTVAGDHRDLIASLAREVHDSTRTVVVSSEDFTLPRASRTPEQFLEMFDAFGRVEVVLVLRRQDRWIESWYKQRVDQYRAFETRSFGQFLAEEGPRVLDFHARFSPWRDGVGPGHFHALSYDDLDGGRDICRRILELAGADGRLAERIATTDVPRYASVRAIDTVGLRLLNTYRLRDRKVRTEAAREIYARAPHGDISLMSSAQRVQVERSYRPGNDRIAREWLHSDAPRFLDTDSDQEPPEPLTAREMVRYVDDVVAVCEAARQQARAARDSAPRRKGATSTGATEPAGTSTEGAVRRLTRWLRPRSRPRS